ncbi:hypothetical protein DPO94_08365 [Salmonella enterica subsp. enterica serovar Emek]|uniref:Uncharacterized protein n=1 Tax=Salmonella enterica subsp. enterica serovar Kalamu TaxID=2564590 RepID=A0A5V8Y500_SALET|nr:hypothetical protein [Salmonella enterica subsp. enterica serovar Java]EAA3932103.1 hypothetical protein [Salmonella enterica subsp. enterica serovar Livingstone]EAA5044213.1 hypothetical protein [Salmonella enterica subsp. enterica serovar London]EAB6376574.1 hypothetical protein [Salmonella enterica subsp. enterica serovar Emek]EAB9202421.1 hypothetical protein [Salmonella enterica subsp. enterica serovar Neukoelln]EAN0051819.1 hypothetical protein [Salmonella enterica]EBS3703227.1 hypot
MFTQDFFTENATHKQNCTSFNPKPVITYNVNYGKPFLNVSRSVAQITRTFTNLQHVYATKLRKIYPHALTDS